MSGEKEKNGVVKRFLYNPWVIGVGTFLIGTLAVDVIRGVQLGSILSWIVGIIGTALTWRAPLWTFVVAIVGLWIVLWLLSGREREPPAYLQYTEEPYEKWLFQWSWYRDRDGEYKHSSIWPICSKCKCELRKVPMSRLGRNAPRWTHFSPDHHVLLCPECGATYEVMDQDTYELAETAIAHRVRQRMSNDSKGESSPQGGAG